MNPSASGWIKKLLNDATIAQCTEIDPIAFYTKLKHTGFIYGTNTSVVFDIVKPFDFSEEERCKLNLLIAFYFVYSKGEYKVDFVESLIEYYKSISIQKRSFFEELFGDKSPYRLLENMIHKRIHIEDSFLAKSFNYFLINALLFVDVLGYQQYLKLSSGIRNYVVNLESGLETIVFSVIDAKALKSEYDSNLIKLFQSSIRHKHTLLPSYEEAIGYINEPLEKLYTIDLVCMASWSDKVIDREELAFLNQLKSDLKLNLSCIHESIDHINQFYADHKDEVAFLSSKNLAQSLYDNSSKIVTKLIKRNSKRLIKELSESKEAMALLAKSAQHGLNEEEQKKVQSQLLDIFKSIPSLAIFMLPGGMLLLPLFVKFIPKLLPSAFDDNRIEKE
jgi:hypothetical protein